MPGGSTVRDTDERALFGLPADEPALPAPTPANVEVATAAPVAGPPGAFGWLHNGSARFARALPSAFAIERDRGALFLLTPVFMAVGVFAYLALPAEPSLPALLFLTLLAATLAIAAGRSPLIASTLVLATACLAGIGFARLETAAADTKMLGGEISTVVTGRVAEVDYLANGRVRLTLDITNTERPHLRYAPDRVRVSTATAPKGLKIGDVVNGAVRLFPPSGPLRPGSYDFAYQAYYDGIGANGFFFKAPRIVGDDAETSWIQRTRNRLANLRNAIAAHIERAVDGKAEGEIVAALIVGTRAGIPEDVNESLRRTGLAHILSISGLHMALVAISVMGTMRLCLALLPGVASRYPVKKGAALVALLAITGYLLISGVEVAALRSYIMLAVMLLAAMFDRAAISMRNLAIAAIITLAIMPHEVVGPSFQMSFAATAALVGGFQIWTDYRRRRPRRATAGSQGVMMMLAGRALSVIAMVALTSILAGLATTIYGVWHFQRVSPLSLIANVLVSPIITVAMWTGVLASAAAPFGLDGPLFALMGKLVGLMLSISAWLSARTPVDAVGAIPAASVVLFTLALVIGALATSWIRWAALVPLALGLGLLAGRPFPDILISEDARLVALVDGDKLAVNRARPNRFTITDWQRATAAHELVKPASGNASTADPGVFACGQGACVARTSDGLIAQVDKATQLADYCGRAALVVVSEPTLAKCADPQTTVISARDLARRGVATVTFDDGALTLAFAIQEPYRPWHDHRAFSRAARGLAPFVPRPRPKPGETTQPSPQ